MTRTEGGDPIQALRLGAAALLAVWLCLVPYVIVVNQVNDKAMKAGDAVASKAESVVQKFLTENNLSQYDRIFTAFSGGQGSVASLVSNAIRDTFVEKFPAKVSFTDPYLTFRACLAGVLVCAGYLLVSQGRSGSINSRFSGPLALVSGPVVFLTALWFVSSVLNPGWHLGDPLTKQILMVWGSPACLILFRGIQGRPLGPRLAAALGMLVYVVWGLVSEKAVPGTNLQVWEDARLMMSPKETMLKPLIDQVAQLPFFGQQLLPMIERALATQVARDFLDNAEVAGRGFAAGFRLIGLTFAGGNYATVMVLHFSLAVASSSACGHRSTKPEGEIHLSDVRLGTRV